MNHAYKRQIILVKNVGGVDGPLTCEDVITNSSNMKSVYIKLGTHWKMKYCSTQLYKFKFHLETTPPCFNLLGFICCE
jgi:hypothetical protein